MLAGLIGVSTAPELVGMGSAAAETARMSAKSTRRTAKSRRASNATGGGAEERICEDSLCSGLGPGWPACPYVAANREMTPPLDFAGSLRSLALWPVPAGGRSRYVLRQLVAPTHGPADIAVDLKRRRLLREDASTSSTVMNSQRLSSPDGACSSRIVDFDVVSVAA